MKPFQLPLFNAKQYLWQPIFLLILVLFPVHNAIAVGEDFNIQDIDDTPRERDIQYPDWFKNSFLDLQEDLDEALDSNKIGLIVYFGQKNCAYCEALIQINFGREMDIVEYTRRHFDVIAIDIWGDREVTDFQGKVLIEKKYAEREKANLTPTLIFYGKDGAELLQLHGYYTPYKLRAALEFIVDGFYKQETLRDYIARANPPALDGVGKMNPEDFFQHPPYILDRSHIAAQKPLAVFFEQRNCHACDILHTDPLNDDITRLLLEGFDVVQLDMWSDTPVLTPDGQKLSAKDWAHQLGLFYSPSILFFDGQGKEVFRLSSVVRVYRLRGVLEYVLYKGYLNTPGYQRWREQQSLVPFTASEMSE
jgi:thioredoxin-related protein